MKKYSKLFSLKGKIAVVAGGGGLIGSEIVSAFAECGAVAYTADVKPPERKAASPRSGGYLTLDISSEKSVKQMFERVLRDNGRLDVFVNSAYPRTGDWWKKTEYVPMASWKKNLDTHLGGYFSCARAAAEAMKRTSTGSIISLSSIYGVVAPDFSLYEGTPMTMPAAYSAIKGGIISLTRYLAAYYAPHKIRVNSISPGGVLNGQPPTFVERYESKTPLSRMASPLDVAAAAVFLASDAAAYITGQNLLVDGGWTIR